MKRFYPLKVDFTRPQGRIQLKKISNLSEDKLLIFLVGTVGFEPMTSCMSSMRSNRLSYAPVYNHFNISKIRRRRISSHEVRYHT